MKDWQRSPEPAAMMGVAGPSSPHADVNLLPGAYYAPACAPLKDEAIDTNRARRARPTDMTLSSMATRGSYQVWHTSDTLLTLTHSTVILRNINCTSTPCLLHSTRRSHPFLACSTVLDSVGDMPYRIARPLLVTCRADQLAIIEENSPVRCMDT